MNKTIKHHARALMMAGLSLGEVTALPENPQLNTIINYNGDVLLYTDFSGVNVWYPLVRGADTKTFRMVQAVSALTWTVSHQLNTKDLIMVVKDADGVEQDGVEIEYSVTDGNNEFTITFSEPVAGSVFLVAMQNISSPEINTSVLNVGGNFVIDTSGITFNGQRINLQEVAALADDLAAAEAAAATANASAVSANSKADSALLQAASAAGAAGTAQTTANNALTVAQAADAKATATALVAGSYDIGFGTNSDEAVTVGLNIGGLFVARKSRIPAYSAGTVVGKTDAAATATTTFSVQKNGTQVAVLTVAAGSTNVTISGQAAIDLAVTDRVKVLAVNADAGLKGIDGTILNTLQP